VLNNLAVVAISNGPLMLRGFVQVFALGFAGGLVGELLGLHELRRSAPAELPKYLRSGFYWFVSVLMACAGGGLATLYGTENVQGLLAMNIGASAPLILRSFASSIPPIAKPRID
jgi:hypothetical protein